MPLNTTNNSRPTTTTTLTSSWTNIVPATETEPAVPNIITLSQTSKEIGDNNAEVSKKPSWSKKPNGGDTVGGRSAVVMGVEAELWPALSDCVKLSSKHSFSFSSSNDSSKNQMIVIDMSSTTTIVSSGPSSPRNSQKITSSVLNDAIQPSMTPDDEGTSEAKEELTRECSESNSSSSPKLSSSSPIESNNIGSTTADSSGPKPSPNVSTKPNSSSSCDSSRKVNRRPHSRAETSRQNYGFRRNEQHGYYDWNHQSKFSGMHQGSVGFVRPPLHYPTSPQHFMDPTMMPFWSDASGIFFPGAPYYAHIPPWDPVLHSKIITQVNYYFSNDNLVKDVFLRRNMDKNGWVSIHFISKFNRMKDLTSNTDIILEAVRFSNVVEVQGYKIRRQGDWKKWILPQGVQFPG